jgi:Spy/CpxP family protein refolding chaperone
MNMSAMSRARLLGLVVVVLAFVAGVTTGMAIDRRPRQGMSLTVTATDAMPRELERLGLTDSQRTEIRAILVRGRDRVIRVVRDFEPIMRTAVDSTDREIGTVLTPEQRAALERYRRDNPPMMERRIIRQP